MKLYVVRHSITNGNILGHINGQLDDLLTDEGRANIQNIVEKLHEVQIDAVYASPLQRTVDTATPIAADHSLPVVKDARLIEVGMGSFEGKPYGSTVEYFGLDSPSLLSSYNYDLSAYGGESVGQVENRVRSLIDDLSKSGNETILLVTHGGTMRMINYVCTGQKIGTSHNLALRLYEL